MGPLIIDLATPLLTTNTETKFDVSISRVLILDDRPCLKTLNFVSGSE